MKTHKTHMESTMEHIINQMGQLNLHLLQSKTNKIKNVKERPINDAL